MPRKGLTAKKGASVAIISIILLHFLAAIATGPELLNLYKDVDFMQEMTRLSQEYHRTLFFIAMFSGLATTQYFVSNLNDISDQSAGQLGTGGAYILNTVVLASRGMLGFFALYFIAVGILDNVQGRRIY